MNLSFEWTNLDSFAERLGAAVVEKRGIAEGRLKELGEHIVEDATALAPVGTGNEDVPGELRESLAAQPQEDGSVRVGSFGVPYAKYVEFGTSKMRAEPFLRPALAAAHGAFGKR